MWILIAFASALFAGITAILAKCGIKNTDSDVATALRTGIVLLFAWILVFLTGAQTTLNSLTIKTWLFLILSGLATGASWLCYFKALQIGDVNKVTPIDKSSTVLSMLLAFLFLKEQLTTIKIIAMFAIGVGTFLMIQEKQKKETTTDSVNVRKNAWFFYALGSAIFASLTSILGKVGIQGVDSRLGTAIRTGVVLIMAWLIVFLKNKKKGIWSIDKKSWIFLVLSGLTTGGSWLCYYRALQLGEASVVVPIDKLSILFTIVFSYIVFKEKLNIKSLIGLCSIVAGTLLLLIR